ncbi:MAG: ADP-ribosylglycohydrolase family protein [Promethearchaeota archaeon]
MLGAIFGDIIGEPYEIRPIKTKNFPIFNPNSHFTDDTVLSIAIAKWILEGGNLASIVQKFARRYPNAGYGSNFIQWIHQTDLKPYNSWGNGSAMRVSPVGFAYKSLNDVLFYAKETAIITHNHPEGIKGAQATASAIFLAHTGKTKQEIKNFLSSSFSYDLSFSLDEIRPGYHFDASCQGTVPQAIVAFLESTSFEDAIRNAVSLGGDSDTLACITGGIAQAFYGIPSRCLDYVYAKLDKNLANIVREFTEKYYCIN